MHQGYSPDSVRRVRPVLSEQQCQRPLPQAKTMTRKNAHAATRGNPAPPRAGAGVPPTFRELGMDECSALLTRHNVGRLAYLSGKRVAIEPIHYVFEEGMLYGRTSPGSKVDALAHRPWVAFEVDEMEGIFDWRSVEVQGTYYRADEQGSPTERDAWAHAVELLSALVPATMTPSDPVSFRNVVFRIHVDHITGRESRS